VGDRAYFGRAQFPDRSFCSLEHEANQPKTRLETFNTHPTATALCGARTGIGVMTRS